ncbi:MAG: putative membrane protein YedE/YeeE [Sulfitobacter sp.]
MIGNVYRAKWENIPILESFAMFESFGFESVTPQQASVLLAALIGLVFGVLAQRTKFCFRRSLVGEDRRAAGGVWFMALAVAVIGTQAAVAAGWISFDEHRFMTSAMPVLAIAAGGLLFGAGMVLTRGCVSRLTVLSGSGNLRAALVVLVFAVVAHMTLKGVLAPLRIALGTVTVEMGDYISLAALPGGAWLWAVLIAGVALAYALRSGNSGGHLVMAALIGLLVPLAWVGTGFILFDAFDPIAMESLSFTSPASETLFWSIASSSIPAGFGTGLLGGVFVGALAASLIFGGFDWQSFETPRQTGRYLLGAALMGTGGVLAGGCTLGAGLSGVPSLSVAAILAIVMIALGAKLTHALLSQDAFASAAPSTTPRPQQAA